MCVHGYILFFVTIGCAVFLAKTNTDPKKCVSKKMADSVVIKAPFCLVTKQDVHLECLQNEIVVLSGLQLAIKNKKNVCMKRILGQGSRFCCYLQETDVIYDSHCLQDIWNSEDIKHYGNFVTKALNKCTNTSHCVLDAAMFNHLQREIPASENFSSYFQVVYQCIPAPASSTTWCSSKSMTGKDIHIQQRGTNDNKTCTCRASTTGVGDVTVRAVDVRSANTNIILSSGKSAKTLSLGSVDVPLFGFRTIYSAKNFNITLRLGFPKPEEKLWLHLSGSNGQTVKVTCGEYTSQVEMTPTFHAAKPAPTITRKTVFWGHWPLVYIGAGSLFTIVIVACILGSVLLCRQSSSKSKRPRHPHHSCPLDFHQDPYAHPYATVLDDNPHPASPRPPQSMSPEHRGWSYDDKSYVRSTSMRSICHSPAPSFPPPNVPGHAHDVVPSPSPRRSHLGSGRDSDVSRLEAFLKC